MSVISRVRVGDYLLGVVGGEMPASWPLEALKAQAVAARTYVWEKIRKRGGAAYDVTDDVRSQVYIGVPPPAEAEALEKAVRGTAREVLMWKGAPIPAYFHSTCGGRTASAESVFGAPAPRPLAGVACGFCTESKVYRWEVKLAAAELEKTFGARGVTRILPRDPDAGGRVRVVRIESTEGGKDVASGAFRMALGPGRVRSTAFTAERAGTGFLLQGRGWGHGVGLCQWGAAGQARAGRTYRAILLHYYPEAQIVTMEGE
jgi:stage II sporulation protein D